MKKAKRLVLIVVQVPLSLMLSMASIALAQEVPNTVQDATTDDSRVRDWHLRFGFVAADTDGQTSVAVDPGSVDISLSGGGGAFVSLERKVTPLLGIEFGTSGVGADMNVSTDTALKHFGTEVDVLTMNSLTLGANFHIVRDKSIDVHAGPMLVFNRYSEWSVHTDGDWWSSKHDHWVSIRSKSDSELTWGARIGMDVALNKRGTWTLGGSFSYIDATYDFAQESGQEQSSIHLDPTLFSFGVGYRF